MGLAPVEDYYFVGIRVIETINTARHEYYVHENRTPYSDRVHEVTKKRNKENVHTYYIGNAKKHRSMSDLQVKSILYRPSN